MNKHHGSPPIQRGKKPAGAPPDRCRTVQPPGRDDMAAIFERCGVVLSSRQLDEMWAYHGLLRRHNSELNLTRIHNFSNMVLKLYVDSVLPGTLSDLPSPLMDLGTGPGMPGIPLKILHPDLELWLAEGRAKRTAFLEETIKNLGLTQVRIIARNITPQFTEPVAGVITRAVETIDRTLERVSGCLKQEGLIIFMKGPGCDDEVEHARQRFRSTYRLTGDTPYRIGDTSHDRRLITFERIDESPLIRAQKAARRHRVISISGEHNSRFKALKKLLSGRGLKKADQALMSGPHPVAETLARRPERCLAWITESEQSPPPENAPAELEWVVLTPPLFQTLDLFGTHSPLLLIRTAAITPWQPTEGFPAGCTLLIPFQDPENVGAAIRSAAAFGATQVILLAESAHPYHPKSMRAAAGSLDLVQLRQGPALAELPSDLPIIALSAEGREIGSTDFPPAFGLLVGMEGPGLSAYWRSRSVRIPIRSGVESLNGAAAVSVAMYEWSRRR